MIKLTLSRPTKTFLLSKHPFWYMSAPQNLHGKLGKCVCRRNQQERHFLFPRITIILFGVN